MPKLPLLSELQMRRLRPFFPVSHGLRRVDDQGVVSGIIYVIHTGYGSTAMLDWLVHEQGIEPHIPVFDKSTCKDGTFSRSDFTHDHERDLYVCPADKELMHYRPQFR